MTLVVVALAVLAMIAIVGTAVWRRQDALAEVERFHRARAMTTAWSQAYQETYRNAYGPAAVRADTRPAHTPADTDPANAANDPANEPQQPAART